MLKLMIGFGVLALVFALCGGPPPGGWDDEFLTPMSLTPDETGVWISPGQVIDPRSTSLPPRYATFTPPAVGSENPANEEAAPARPTFDLRYISIPPDLALTATALAPARNNLTPVASTPMMPWETTTEATERAEMTATAEALDSVEPTPSYTVRELASEDTLPPDQLDTSTRPQIAGTTLYTCSELLDGTWIRQDPRVDVEGQIPPEAGVGIQVFNLIEVVKARDHIPDDAKHAAAELERLLDEDGLFCGILQADPSDWRGLGLD